VAQAFLNHANAQLQQMAQGDVTFANMLNEVSVFPAVPMSIQRVANVERAQMLLESTSRSSLHKVLDVLQTCLHEARSQPEHKGLIRWLVDVDPLAI
jgi:primosomal protein N' (replication factor Y)